MIGRVIGDELYFDYRCESCGESGELRVLVHERGLVGCPAGCGAGYLPWRDPGGRWRLTCVVCALTTDEAQQLLTLALARDPDDDPDQES